MNGQKKGDKKIHSDPQNTTQKIEQHEPHKKMSEHRCYGRVSSSCSTSDIRGVPAK